VSRRLWIVAILASLALFAGPSSAAADQLGLQSVDTSGWPNVAMMVTLPSSAGGIVPRAVRVWENGVEVAGAQIKGLSAEPHRTDVVLAIDVSGSMKGAPLADAQEAARGFVAQMSPQDRVAVVAFGPSPHVATGFTSDSKTVSGAVAHLSASGETALYDGISSAVDLLDSDATPRRVIVVLSDGKDTVSSTNLDMAINAALKARISVYVVALKSGDYDPDPLRAIANATGGRLTSAQQSSSLGELFGAIATELNTPYEVAYTSRKPNTPDLEVRIAIDGAKVPLTKTAWVTNPEFIASAQPFVPVQEPTNIQRLMDAGMWVAIVALTGVAVFLLGFALLGALIRVKRPIDELGAYDQTPLREVDLTDTVDTTVDPSRLRVLGLVDLVASRRGFTGLARLKLERAGLALRPSEYILLHLVGVILIGSLAELISRNIPFTILIVFAATGGPLLFLEWLALRRRAAFERQLPEILTLIGGSLRAGWGLQQSIDLVVKEAAEPVVTEFRRVQTEARLGLPLDQALTRVAERLDSDDFRWTASAIGIQREVGGNLAEVLDTLAAAIRERAELYREVRSLTAEGRFSAVVLGILPFVMALILFVMNPSYITLLVTSPFGLIMLVTGIMLLLIGMFWLQRAVRVDV
jgi:tight adherence protein B